MKRGNFLLQRYILREIEDTTDPLVISLESIQLNHMMEMNILKYSKKQVNIFRSTRLIYTYIYSDVKVPQAG